MHLLRSNYYYELTVYVKCVQPQRWVMSITEVGLTAVNMHNPECGSGLLMQWLPAGCQAGHTGGAASQTLQGDRGDGQPC